jgi:hypothetical protein
VADHIFRYDPTLGRCTNFDLPRRGTEVRFISLDESRGQLEVLIPIYRTGQMGIMTIRSEADMAEARRVAQSANYMRRERNSRKRFFSP